MSATAALAKREVVRFLRQPSRVVGAVAPPLLVWLLIGSGFGSSFRAPGGEASPIVYFYPGIVVLVILFASIFATISVIEDRREGFLQSVLVAPSPRTRSRSARCSEEARSGSCRVSSWNVIRGCSGFGSIWSIGTSRPIGVPADAAKAST